jgi:hypothetical protein
VLYRRINVGAVVNDCVGICGAVIWPERRERFAVNPSPAGDAMFIVMVEFHDLSQLGASCFAPKELRFPNQNWML